MESPTHSIAFVQEIVDGFFVFASLTVEAEDYRLVFGHGSNIRGSGIRVVVRLPDCPITRSYGRYHRLDPLDRRLRQDPVP